MLKYKKDRKLISIECDHCKTEFEKPISEYNRNISKGFKNYCSRSCSGKSVVNVNRLMQYQKINDISKYSHNKIDEFTGFRYYLRNAKKRYKDFDLTLEDLKNQWDKQNGICPYTKFNLLLFHHNIKNPYHLRASLDRIDSSKGYTKDNIEFVSLPINYLKNDQITKNEVFELLAHIALVFTKD